MTTYFHSPTALDLQTIRLLGVSVKETENPIGYFGTGMKYALAILLRTGHSVSLQTAGTTVQFSTKVETIRGQDFSVIYMGEEQLGFTTELGKNWSVREAYRELASNALDEGGGVSRTPVEAVTVFTVSGPEIDQIEHDAVFLPKVPPLYAGTNCEIYPGDKSRVYYRGVCVGTAPYPTVYNYHILSPIELTEDRTAKNWAQIESKIRFMVEYCTDRQVLRNILLAPPETVEANLRYLSPVSTEFLEVVAANKNHFLLNKSAYQIWRDTQPPEEPTPVTLDSLREEDLAIALKLVARLGFTVHREELNIVTGLGQGIMGCYRDGKIYIADRTFDHGPRYLASTIFEEVLHRDEGFHDCSRDMQNYLFERLLSFTERLIPLEEKV